jgi:hypothetical protein
VNVSGVGATPPPPPLPPVAPPQRATAAPASGGRPGTGASGQRAEREREQTAPGPAVHEPPPLRVLTVTEMRVMLGQLPASAAFKLEQQHGHPSVAS